MVRCLCDLTAWHETMRVSAIPGNAARRQEIKYASLSEGDALPTAPTG
jgi:hypothetical protein